MANRCDIRRDGFHGFSLVEILLALFLLSSMMAVFLNLLSGGRKQLEASSNSFTATYLAEKVLNDVLEDCRLNTTYLEYLKTFPEFRAKNRIVDGESEGFRYFKDKKAPWGCIESGTEGGIRPEDGIIFRNLAPFKLEISASRMESGEGKSLENSLAEVHILLDWTEKGGQKRSFSLPVILPSPAGPIPPEGLSFNEETLEKRTREILFPSQPGKTLGQVIEQNGMERASVLLIGKLAVLADLMGQGLASISAQISHLSRTRRKLPALPSPGLLNIQLGMARQMECGASLRYNLCREMLPLLGQFFAGDRPPNLRGIPLDKLNAVFATFRTAIQEIPPWVKCTLESYEWLLQDDLERFQSLRHREFVRGKILDAFRLLNALGQIPHQHYRSFLDREIGKVSGKNPFLWRLYLREKRLLENSVEWKAAFPNLTFIEKTLQTDFTQMAGKCSAFLAEHHKRGLSKKEGVR